MEERKAMVAAWRSLPAGQDAVLATVVHVTGSAYRRPGARMMMLPGGERIGSISGGCLESDVARKAWWWTESDASLKVFDTSSDDDAVWEFGLGCNGVIEVLLERVRSYGCERTLSFLEAGTAGVLPVVIRATPGSAWKPGLRFPSHPELAAHMQEVEAARRSRLVHLPEGDVFVEYIGEPQRLVIFGAGHDAVPLARMAKQLGWHVTVADPRPAYARPERFGAAADVVIRLAPSKLAECVEITSDAAVVMMTHNYPLDVEILPAIARAQPRYLGILGPRQRADRLFRATGCHPDAHAPAGLDVGAETPEAIALSIVAEIQTVLSGRSGRSLRLRLGPIHEAADEAGATVAQQESSETVSCELAGAPA